MPRTIIEWFDDFHQNIKLVKAESATISSHRKSIESCLKSNMWLTRFFKTWSIWNGTNVAWYSDTDYFAWIPLENLNTNFYNSLVKVKGFLQKRFPNTNIHIDSPAVVLDFWTAVSETTEIVPVYFIKEEDGYNIYGMPDRNTWWMRSSPKAANSYVTNINSDLSYRVKPLIRFVKALKFYRSIPISSYYLEMKIAKYAESETSIHYLLDIKRILKMLIDCELSSMINPTGIWGYIHPCTSDTKKKDALSKLNTAHTRISNAYDSKESWDIKDAFDWLDLAYNGKFPSYYK